MPAAKEPSVEIGRCEQADKLRIAVIKLTDAAKMFYNGSSELHEEGVTWQEFKNAFRQRHRDINTNQYHFTKLQTARKGRNRSHQKFADRCRALAQKIMVMADDPVAQRIRRENAERMLLANFVAGITGVVGRQVLNSSPQGMEQALSIALSAQEAEKQETFNERFHTKFENSVRLLSRSLERTYREDSRSRHSADTHALNLKRGQHYKAPRSTSKPITSGTRSSQTKAAQKYYECEGMGHFARECPTRLKGRQNPLTRRERKI